MSLNSSKKRHYTFCLVSSLLFCSIFSSSVQAAKLPNSSEGLATAIKLLNGGLYAEAEQLLKNLLDTLEQSPNPNPQEYASVLSNLGLVFKKLGRFSDAEPLYKRALESIETSFGTNHSSVPTHLNYLASLYVSMARYEEAEPLYKRSLQIQETINGLSHPSISMTLMGLANIYNSQERSADAENLYQRSLSIAEKAYGPNHPLVAATLNNLATLYGKHSRYGEAELLYKRSLSINEKTHGPFHENVAACLHSLAALYDRQGRYSDAEPLITKALEIREKLFGADHPDIAASLINLATIYVNQKKYSEAEPIYKRSLELNERLFGPNHSSVGKSLNSLATLYLIQKNISDALPLINRAINNNLFQKNITLPILKEAEDQNIIDRQNSFLESFKVFQLSYTSGSSEASKKLGQRISAGTGNLAQLARLDQDLEIEAAKIDKALLEFVSKNTGKQKLAEKQKLYKRAEEVAAERTATIDLLKKEFPEYLALSKPQPLSIQETQSLLSNDEAIIAFDIGEKHSYAWVVTKTDGFWTEIPLIEKELNSEVNALRTSLTNKEDRPFDSDLSFKIYQNTFGTIAEKFSGKKRLSIVTNGAFTSLPFGTLITSDPAGKSLQNMDWLLRTYAVTILPSIYSLKTLRMPSKVAPASRPMIAFADPAFSNSAKLAALQSPKNTIRSLTSINLDTQKKLSSLVQRLEQLPGTRLEVQTIAQSLTIEEQDLKLGLDATETAVKKTKLDEYRVVYFATHGLISDDFQNFAKVKAEPALAFSTPDKPSETDDGLLYASEVAELKLNADWVVLSACNTASSDGVGAEPLSGLARAFLYAGGKSLLVSHWDVSDEATAQLMSTLFALTKDKPTLSHGELLQEAMLQLIAPGAKDENYHPRIWAPFVVVGEPGKEVH